jgi:hypothetical protein
MVPVKGRAPEISNEKGVASPQGIAPKTLIYIHAILKGNAACNSIF